jgi:tetratricopeptide (TPR) repeat protein
MLHAYELGMLTDDERRELELHLLECDSCMQEATQFGKTIRTIRQSADIRESVRRIAEDPADGSTSERRRSLWTRKRWTAIVPTTLAMAAILLVLILKPWHIEIRSTREAVASENRLVIMYFENLADPDDTAKLGEIVTNLLIADLSESQYVQVVSEQRMYDILRLLGEEGTTRVGKEVATAVAEKVRARWLLLGKILQIEPECVLSGQLVEVSTGKAVASQRVSSSQNEDIFSTVDKLTVEIKKDLELPSAAHQEPDRLIADVTTHSPEAYFHYLEGVDFFRKYYWSDSRERFEKAVAADSTFAMAYYFLAMLKDARLLDKAVEYSSNASQMEKHYIRSLKASVSGDKDQAIAELKELVKHYPDEKRAYYLMGRYALGRRDYEKSLLYLNKAIEIDPLYNEAYNSLSYVYSCIRDLDKAIWAINKYIELAPDEANPYDTRGSIYAGHGNLDKAIESYRKALDIKPDFYQSLSYLGIMHLFKREYAVAESCFEAYSQLDTPQLRLSGRLYLSYLPIYRGKFTQGLRLIDERIAACREEMPNLEFPFLHGLKTLIYHAMHNPELAAEEALKAAEGYRKNHPTDKENFQHLYIQMLAESGDIAGAEEAAAQLKSDLEEGRFGMSSYWYALGSIEMSKDNPDSAVASFKRAADEDTDFSIHYMLARAYVEAGMLGEAVAEFEKQLSIYTSPRSYCGTMDVLMRYYLGVAYEESRWNKKAIEQYEAFLDYWRDADPQIWEIEDAENRLTRLKNLP